MYRGCPNSLADMLEYPCVPVAVNPSAKSFELAKLYLCVYQPRSTLQQAVAAPPKIEENAHHSNLLVGSVHA
jgi:hypothetical protein